MGKSTDSVINTNSKIQSIPISILKGSLLRAFLFLSPFLITYHKLFY
ncbi:hypothetical protein LEP1GSC092_0534 [Leptospira interrogans serovar Pyrogenes str. R168]|nr:hypothetical protein LEP1GSC092_0534 [Leptospira interrogans serovar Pyrogenes str. R168]